MYGESLASTPDNSRRKKKRRGRERRKRRRKKIRIKKKRTREGKYGEVVVEVIEAVMGEVKERR